VKLTRKKVILALVAVIVGLGMFWLWKRNQKPPTTYREVTLDRGDITVNVTATGTVQPQNRLEIKPPISGRVDEILVNEGQVVKKGQILAWMSSTERAALLDSARSQGEAEVKRWEELYRATPVIAPIRGTIIQRSVESGQSFTNVDAILVMSDRLTVQAQVDETDLAAIKLDQPAEIVLDAYSKNSLRAKVAQIAYEAKTVNNVTTYIVDVLPLETPDYMRSGMTANVIFNTEIKKDILRVPNDVLKTSDGQTTVLVKTPNGPPASVPIEVGLSDGKYTEVVSGLEGNETLLVKELDISEKENSNIFSPKIKKRSKGSGKKK
jgi:membrane fusion protein, macrolide-specific efflux system